MRKRGHSSFLLLFAGFLNGFDGYAKNRTSFHWRDLLPRFEPRQRAAGCVSDDDDHQRFIELIQEACGRVPMRVLAWCLMSNHFHLVLWPHAGGELSRWMQWLLTSHVRRYHSRYHSSGHVWQGRFNAFSIQQDQHLLTVIRKFRQIPGTPYLILEECQSRDGGQVCS